MRVLSEIGVVGDRAATPEGAREFRLALEQLGTTYIKLGQLLSSRPDLLPDVYIEELGRLVDEVPPVPFAALRPVIEAELGTDVFASIDERPLAAASIAQIHGALLQDGRAVVVKVRRPGVKEQVDLDLDVLRSTARLLKGHSETAQLLQLRALTEELEMHLRAELDFREEAHNAKLIAKLVEGYECLVVPRVIRPYATESVLVLERIDGKKVTEEDRPARGERGRGDGRRDGRAPRVEPVLLLALPTARPDRADAAVRGPPRQPPRDRDAKGRRRPDGSRQSQERPRVGGEPRGAAMIIVGLLVASALMARVSHAVALAGFVFASLLGLYMLWKIIRTPGEL